LLSDFVDLLNLELGPMIQHFIFGVQFLPALCKVVALLLELLFEILPGEANDVLRPLPDDLLGVPLEDPW